MPGDRLGAKRMPWQRYDACVTTADGASIPEAFTDKGLADVFQERQLRPNLLETACREIDVGLPLGLGPDGDCPPMVTPPLVEGHLPWHGARLSASSA